MISGFTHRVGVHCATTAFRDVLEYEGALKLAPSIVSQYEGALKLAPSIVSQYEGALKLAPSIVSQYEGFPLSEDMCFGLGSGLGFTYWKTKRMPFPFVGGRTRDLEKELCRNLGIEMKAYETRSRKKAYFTLRELILEDQLVIINVDLYYLPYFWGGQEPPPGTHFGGHFIVVAGIDEEKGVAYVADTNFSGLQEIKLKDLEEARDSRHRPFPPRNRWYTLKVPEELTPLSKAIQKALTKNYQEMLNPPIKNLGLKGMKYFAQDIVNWPQEIAPSFLNPALVNTYIYMEEDGTGGGLFRRVYARFLKEAGEILGNAALKDLSLEYEEVANHWTDLAKIFLEASKTNDREVFTKSQPKILEIATLEEKALLQFNQICNTLKDKP